MPPAATSGLTRQSPRRWVKIPVDSDVPCDSDNPKDRQWHTTW